MVERKIIGIGGTIARNVLLGIILMCEVTFVKSPYVLSNTIDGFFKRLIERYYLDVGLTQKPKFMFDNAYRRERVQLLVEVIHENHLDKVFAEHIKDEIKCIENGESTFVEQRAFLFVKC